MVSEPDTGRCASEEVKTRGGVPTRSLGPKGVDLGVPH